MNVVGYANRQRTRAALHQPRNMKAVQEARDRDVPLIVSFVGDAPWSNPTIYCDSGQRYDWSFVTGVHLVVVVRPGVATLNAFEEILERADVIGVGYPVLVDIEQQEVACIVHGYPVGLWQVRRGTALWQQYFASPP